MQLRTVIPTVKERFTRPNVLDLIPESTGNVKHPFPVTLRSPLLDVASANVICSVALTGELHSFTLSNTSYSRHIGVLLFQAARWWAEEKDTDSDDAADLVEATSAPTTAPQSDAEVSPEKPAISAGTRKKLPVRPKAES
jgi:hypothetical protein